MQPAPATTVPRRSPIANKLERHASHAWTNIPIPHQAIQVRIPSTPHPENPTNLHVPPHATQELSQIRPPYGMVVSHGRRLMPRAGSPAYWVPRLVVHPSVHEKSGSHGLHAAVTPTRSSAHKALQSISYRTALAPTCTLKSVSSLTPAFMLGK